MLRLRRLTPSALQDILERARIDAPSYADIGATQGQTLPPGYRHDRYEAVLGRGGDVFDRSVRALRNWQAQRGAGVAVVLRRRRRPCGEFGTHS